MSIFPTLPFRGATALLFLILNIFLLSEVSAQTLQSRLQTGKGESTVIKSDALEIDNKRGTVTFTGNVEAVRGNMVIHSRKMLVSYDQKGDEKTLEKKGFKIEKIVASGDVRIDRKEGGSATADEAVFYQDEEKVVLRGNPLVKQGEDIVEGEVITLFLKEDRSVVEGGGDRRVRAVLGPRDEKR